MLFLGVISNAASQQSEVSGESDVLLIAQADCSRLKNMVAHIPDDDATYKPGVDVRGKPVVGADLNDYSALADKVRGAFSFDVSIDVVAYMRALGAAYSEGLEGQRKIGVMTYNPSMQSFFLDGEPLHNDVREEIWRACKMRDKMRDAALEPKPDRDSDPDAQ